MVSKLTAWVTVILSNLVSSVVVNEAVVLSSTELCACTVTPISEDCRAESANAHCAAVARSDIFAPQSWIILPVGQSNVAILSSTALAGHVTSPEPPVTAVRGLHGVPAPVIVTQSTDICTIGFAGSVLSVFNHVTDSTAQPPPHVIGVSANSLLEGL